MNTLKSYMRGIPAGIMICIAAIVYLNCENCVAGAFLFSLGLLSICRYKMGLYTGVIGYVWTPDTWLGRLRATWEALMILFGNLLGVFVASFLYCETRMADKIQDRVTVLVDTKLQDSWMSLLFLGIGCGILMYIAVNSYREQESTLLEKILFVMLSVVVFILAGFEHSIADLAYLGLYEGVHKCIDLIGYAKVISMSVVGNAIGAIGACMVNNLLLRDDR